MSYGLLLNINGVEVAFDSKFTAYKLIKSITARKLLGSTEKNRWINTGIFIPDGYDYLIMLSRGDCYATHYGYWGNGKYYNLAAYTGLRFQMNNDREILACHVNGGDGGKYTSDTYLLLDQMIWILIYPKIANEGSFGIHFNGEKDGFSNITDIDSFTSVVWSGDVEITPAGISATDIDERFDKNMLCFFYWEDSDITMSQILTNENEWSSSFLSYGRYYASNSAGNPTDLKAKMVIFGETPINSQNYGLEIYNRDGQVVFNGTTGVFHRPFMVETSKLSVNEEITFQNIKRPMVHPRSIGGVMYDYSAYNNPSGNNDLYDISFSNSGTSLIVRRGVRDPIARTRHYAGIFFSDIPYPVLDASYYFNFGD